MHAASKLDIFTMLSENQMSGEQICRKIKSQLEMTEKLLIACVAMGLLERHEGQYRNTDLAQKYLVRGQELYQGDIIAHSAMVWDFWGALANHVVSGTEPTVIKPADHKSFIMGMHNIAVAGRAKLFIDCIDLTGRKKLFDAGGGPGTYSIEACKRYLELAAVVFDLPETISITKELIEKERMQDRIAVKAGDWATHSFDNDNDVVLFSNVLHGTVSNAKMKLGKAYDSMVGAYSKAELFSLVEAAGFGETKIVAESEEFGCTWIIAEKF